MLAPTLRRFAGNRPRRAFDAPLFPPRLAGPQRAVATRFRFAPWPSACRFPAVLISVFLAILCVMPWQSTTHAQQPAGATLLVMTYNLRYASSEGPHAWPKRRPIAKALIRNIGPDVIGTQEGLYSQIKDLAADLPHYAWIGLGRDGGSRGEFMAVFYRPRRFEPLAFDHFWLSETPDRMASTSWNSACRRMVTWVKFLDRHSGRQFYFFNTHFDHRSQAAREHSAQLVWRRVDELNTDLPVILVGDFNAVAQNSKVYNTLVAPQRFRDAWLEAVQQGRALGTFHGFGGPEQAGEHRIDWILVRGPVRVEMADVVTFSQNGQYPSDHFPVVARLRLDP